jgi:uncharacterized protein YggE
VTSDPNGGKMAQTGKGKDDDMRSIFAMAALMAVPVLAQPMPPEAALPERLADGERRVMIRRVMNEPTLLSVSADAEVTEAPDTLRLSAGVVTEAASADEAMSANAARMTAVVAALKAAGLGTGDIQTSSLSLSPRYRYQPNQSPERTGYQARNSVSVKTKRLGDAGKLIDALVKAGANEVNGPAFSLADPEAALNRARAAAVARARARAEVYAAAAGMTVKRIAAISEPGAEPMPIARPMMARMAAEAVSAEATPVEPGELSLAARVNVTFELDGPAAGVAVEKRKP